MSEWIDRVVGGVWLAGLTMIMGYAFKDKVNKDLFEQMMKSHGEDLAEVKDNVRETFRSIKEIELKLARMEAAQSKPADK